MKCVACSVEVADDANQCSRCGDYVGPWRALNLHAATALATSETLVQQGNTIAALLRGVHACVLQPDDPRSQLAVAKLLVELDDAGDAMFYLKRAKSAFMRLGESEPEDLAVLIERAQAATTQGDEVQSVLHPRSEESPADAACPSEEVPDPVTEGLEPHV